MSKSGQVESRLNKAGPPAKPKYNITIDSVQVP